jgi:hypothetical protein
VSVLAAAASQEHRIRQIDRPDCVARFLVGPQSGIGDDAAAAEFQLQAAVEIDPQRAIIRLTRLVFRERRSWLTLAR